MTASPSRLSHRFGWMLTGNAAIAASQWGMVAILARFSQPEILGGYALGLSVASVAFSLTNLELRTLQVTDPSQQTSFGTYYTLRLATGIGTVVALAALAFVWPYSTAAIVALLAAALIKCLDGLSDVIYGRFQLVGIVAPIGKSQCAKAALSLTLLALALALIPNPLVALGAIVVAYAAVLLVYDLPSLHRHAPAPLVPSCERKRAETSGTDESVPIPKSFRKLQHRGSGQIHLSPMFPHAFFRNLGLAQSAASNNLKSLALAGLPLTIVTTMLTLQAAVPRLVVASRLGEGAAGILLALGYLAIAPNLLMVALGQAKIASLAGSLTAGDRAGFLTGVLQLLSAASLIGLTTLTAGFFAGGVILSTIYGPRFLGHERELMLLVGAGAVSFLNAAVGYSLSSGRVFALQIPMMAAVCGVTLLSSLTFVPRWGIAGAAASQLLSMTVQLVWSSILLARTVTTSFRASTPGWRAAPTSLALHSKP